MAMEVVGRQYCLGGGEEKVGMAEVVMAKVQMEVLGVGAPAAAAAIEKVAVAKVKVEQVVEVVVEVVEVLEKEGLKKPTCCCLGKKCRNLSNPFQVHKS